MVLTARERRVIVAAFGAFSSVTEVGGATVLTVDAAPRSPMLNRVLGRWIALDGDEPAGAAALFAAEGVGYLGLAATLPEHRGKGAQNALLAARIRAAAELGCDAVLTETGERRDDRPSNSYRNILRAGFEEISVTANWAGTG